MAEAITTRPGEGVDAQGGPVVDPTANVQALNEASSKRQDDLRRAESRLQTELRKAETRRVNQIIELNAKHTREMFKSEAGRINAIRDVDVAAAAISVERQTAAATVLASQLATTAEAMRSAVANTAAATATQLTTIINPILDRIAGLERSSFEGIGKGRVTDPLMEQMLVEMRALRQATDQGTGRSGGSEKVVAYVFAAIMALVALGSLVVTLVRTGAN